jgi:protein TonB
MAVTVLARRVLVLLVLVVGLPLVAGAQTAPSPQESLLLANIKNNPAQVGNYLDLAKLYYDQQRFVDAERVLSQGMMALRQQRVALSPTPGAPAPAPSAPSAMACAAAPVRIGGNIKAPTKVKTVDPVYPGDAMQAKIEGMVIIEATICQDGSVADARVLRSVALLDQAALDAVRQWKYTPTTMDGVPVPVVMTVTVNFSLR